MGKLGPVTTALPIYGNRKIQTGVICGQPDNLSNRGNLRHHGSSHDAVLAPGMLAEDSPMRLALSNSDRILHDTLRGDTRSAKSRRTRLIRSARRALAPMAEPNRPQIALFQAGGRNGQTIPPKPFWTSDRGLTGNLKFDQPMTDIIDFVRFANPLVGNNPVFQVFMPGVNFAQFPFILVYDFNFGTPNASHQRGENGEVIISFSNDPEPGSEFAEVLGPVWRDGQVLNHELGHDVVDTPFTYRNRTLPYRMMSGANNEGDSDSFSFIFRKARQHGFPTSLPSSLFDFSSESRDFVNGDPWLLGPAVLRNALDPQQVWRDKDHPFGLSMQYGTFPETPIKDTVFFNRMDADNAGVHLLNSLVSNRHVRTIKKYGDAIPVLQAMMGAYVFAASLTSVQNLTFSDKVFFEMAAAQMIDPSGKLAKDIAEEAGNSGYFMKGDKRLDLPTVEEANDFLFEFTKAFRQAAERAQLEELFRRILSGGGLPVGL